MESLNKLKEIMNNKNYIVSKVEYEGEEFQVSHRIEQPCTENDIMILQLLARYK